MTTPRNGSARLAVVALLALGAAAPRARGQVDPNPVARADTGVLFSSDEPLQLRIAGDLRSLLNDRDTLNASYHDMTLTYRVGEGAAESLDFKVRTRGHWRRLRQNCDFPPLLLNLPKSQLEGTPFAGQDKLKLVTPCRPRRDDYREYVLREFLVYRIYNLLTPLSLRVRMATTTYVDTTGRSDSVVAQTFLLEDPARMAARNGAALMDMGGFAFSDMEPFQLGLMGAFLYMIGGTDWSLPYMHNVDVVQIALDSGIVYHPVPFDFDFTGIVDTRYATPDPRLRIRSVRDRVYRGGCVSPEVWTAVFDRFRERQAAIYALYQNQPGLRAGYVRDTHRYLDEFYELIDDPKKADRELAQRCR